MYLSTNFTLNYSDLSKLEFKYPHHADGELVPFYDDLEIGMIVDARPIGQFVITDVEVNGDGAKETKTCQCESLEYEINSKHIVFAEGTYRLYDPVNTATSLLGILLTKLPNWSIGEVDSELMTRYRTFSDTDELSLSWLLNTAQDTFNCVFDFDTYNRKINVIEQDKALVMVPVYLSYNNLIKSASITHNSDDYYTAISVTGADDLDIRDVNPIGENYIYNLDYSISAGRIPTVIADKWTAWQNTIAAQQDYYIGLVSLRNAASGRYLVEKAKQTDLEGERTSVENRRATLIEALNLASTQDEENHFTQRLNDTFLELKAKDAEIANQKAIVTQTEEEYQGFIADVSAVVSALKKENYFTTEELKILSSYIVEGKFQDSTFAVFDTDVTGANDSYLKVESSRVSFSNINLTDVKMDASTGRRIFNISGGELKVEGTYTTMQADGIEKEGNFTLEGQINNATIDHANHSALVMSAFLGTGISQEAQFPSGNITLSCTANFDDDTWLAGLEAIESHDTDDGGNIIRTVITYSGSASFDTTNGSFYFTRNATEYQRYSVANELYDYAAKCLEDMSSPTYEFDIDSANIIFAQEFENFKNALKLGYGVYLKLDDKAVLKPRLLSVELDFENPKNFKLTFSNSFKRVKDGWAQAKTDMQTTSKLSKLADADKYKNGAYKTSGADNLLKQFKQEGFDAAKMSVSTSEGQQITIDKAGFTAKSETSDYYFRIANGMMALINDNTGDVVLGLGHFYNKVSGTDWTGINAKVIAGDIVLGSHLEIHCPSVDGGTMLFSATSEGVQISNGRLYLDHDRGGKLMLDPTVGFAMGTKELYTVQSDGSYSFNQDNANFYVDLNGKLHLKDIDATGTIHGSVITGSEIYIGGNNTATNCKFGVDKLGNIIGLETMNGNLKFDADGKAYFGNDVNITGSLTLGGNIIWTANSFPIKSQFSVSSTGPWHDDAQSADKWRKDRMWNGEWGAAYQFRGTDGVPGSDGSDASVTRGNIVRAMLQSIDEDGLYTTTVNGKQCLGINATAIRSGVIEGIDIYGGAYYDLAGKSKLILNPSGSSSRNADLVLYSGNNEALMLYDQIADGTSWYGWGTKFLETHSAGTYTYGNWNFTNANVSGLYYTFS